ncbi:MAG: AfsR/SARP family transcriptional regulator [Candidatus Promineifilaceae bacterium]|jgi:DNA-binding SARP family transcriptional activator/predicted ATPase
MNQQIQRDKIVSEISSSKLTIRLLGGFQILDGDKPISGFNADRPQSLLAYLLLHLHIPQPRQHLAFLLWPDSTESQARTNLRNLLHCLRCLLPDPDTYLLADNRTVQWNPEASFDLDVAQFDRVLQAAALAGNNAAMRNSLETAATVYGGDLLPGNYDDWLILLREKKRQQYLDALGKLVTLFEEDGDVSSALRYSRRLWQQDTLDEQTAVNLMRLLAMNGDRAGVRRVYQLLTTGLDHELGLEPSAATREAFTKFLNSESNPGAAPVPLTPQGWRPRPLPIPVTPLIGREKELADIAERLANPDCRLLILAGLSGMGKTRLVLQTAIAQQDVFADGVAFISLTPNESTHFLAAALAGALQLKLSSAEDDWAQIRNFLSSKEMLLVVDDVDHLIANGRKNRFEDLQERFVSLLQAAPRLKLLVTSRQRLDLMGEWLYEIQGLALPETAVAEELTNNSAVQLFLSSARRVDGNFMLTPEDLQPILQICNLVDGMPLGIELAASWVRLLSCAEIVEEIRRNIDFLRTETHNLPQRHRSMRAIFDQSWDLLLPEEKEVLVRLSVFRGAFSRNDAEQKAGASLAALAGLANKSLIHRVDAGQFKLHNLVRQYAALHQCRYDVHRSRTLLHTPRPRLKRLEISPQSVL